MNDRSVHLLRQDPAPLRMSLVSPEGIISLSGPVRCHWERLLVSWVKLSLSGIRQV